MSDLEDAGDAAALEKYYHRNCLQYAKRTCSQVKCDDVKVVCSLCDEELLLIVQNTLVGDDASMTMAELNDEYLLQLKSYSVEAGGVGNYRKHLKCLIAENLSNVRFIKSVRKMNLRRLFFTQLLAKQWSINLLC